jgi:hypothetical protein
LTGEKKIRNYTESRREWVDISVGVSVFEGISAEGAVKDITGEEKCRLRIRKVLTVGLFCNGCSEKAFLKEYP